MGVVALSGARDAVIGAESPWPPLVGRYFGLRNFGQIESMTLELVAPFGAGRTPVVAQNRAEETGRYHATLFFLLGRGMLGLLPIVVLPRCPRVDQAAEDESRAPAPVTGAQPAADRAWPPAAPRA
ncbi:hypothetical protein EV578_10136 [Streptomyces sp. BK205]|nr:hypothetical protein EV578_10136 [Streptomyces sp. BK205]